MHLAAARGHTEIVDRLLAAGADVNAKDQDGYTALHFGAMYNHTAVVKQLLAAGAAPDEQDRDGDTPDTVAGDSELASYLSAERARRMAGPGSGTPA